MAQEHGFQYKVATSEKNPLAPALTRQGARERGFATQHWAYAEKTGGVGQMPTEKGRFSSSGVT